MTMQKAYNRQNFANGTDPALDEVDMNKIDSGLSIVDDRVILLDNSKANKTDVFACVNSIIYTISTGILRITYVSGAVQDVNLGLNNVALSMSPLGVITMQDSEGNTYTCDLREIINSDLAELGDVEITDPEDGQVLKYNAETGKWENGEGGTSQSVLNVVGAKNLLKNKGVSGTYGGATFTFNADGSVNINGTYTLTTPGVREYILMSLSFNDPIEDWMRTYAGKSLIFSKGHGKEIGCIFTVMTSDYSPVCHISADVSEDEGAPVVLNITNGASYSCCLFIDETTVFDNVTVYPMIRFAEDPDDTFEPYAKTNRQLTETEHKPTTDIYNPLVTYAPNDSTKPAYCIFDNKLYKNILQCSGVFPTNTTYWQETNVGKEILSINNSLSKFSETLLYEGNIKTGDVITLAENQNHFKWIVLDLGNLKYLAVNSTYGTSGSYAPLNWSAIRYISNYLVIQSVVTWTVGATEMHIGATLQANLNTSGMAYFSTAEQFSAKIYGYN